MAYQSSQKITGISFQKDERKAGGAYWTVTGKLKMIDEYERVLVLGREEQISFDDVLDNTSKLFGQVFDNED